MAGWFIIPLQAAAHVAIRTSHFALRTLYVVNPQKESAMQNNPVTELPAPPAKIAHFTWRPVSRNDIPMLEALSQANQEVDGREAVQTAAAFEQIFQILREKIQTDTLVAVMPEGGIAAIGLIMLPPSNKEHRAMLTASVHADYRKQGLGTYLMVWMQARARQMFDTLDDDLPRRFSCNTRINLADRIDLFRNNGFTPVRYFNHMARDLDDIPEKPLADSLSFKTWTEDRDIDLMNAVGVAFAEHWGMPVMTHEMWKARMTGTHRFRPDLTYLVMDGDTIAGFLITDVDDDRNAQTGVPEAIMEVIGVMPAYRGRGIASALMAHAMNAYDALNFKRTVLDVDTENVTNALQLYEKMGFEAVRTNVQFEKAA